MRRKELKNLIENRIMKKDLEGENKMAKLLIIDGLLRNNKMMLLNKVLDSDFIVYTRASYTLNKRQKWVDLDGLSWQEEKKLLTKALNNKDNIIYIVSEFSDDLSYLKNKAKSLNYLVNQYVSLTNDIEYIITGYEEYINKKSKLWDFQKICQNYHKRLENYLENNENCCFFEKSKIIEAKNVCDIIKKQIKKINQLELDIRIKKILLSLSGKERGKFNTICKNIVYAQLYLANNNDLHIYEGKAVVVMLCSSCNIKRCKHCYISYKGDFLVNEALDMVKKLKNKYTILLNGAEVLVNDKYLEIYKFLNQKWILTNGIKLLNDRSIVDKLKESGIDTIEMSYHFGIQKDISDISEDQLLMIINLIKKSWI